MALRGRAAAAALVLGSEFLYGSLLTFEPRAHMGRLMIVTAALFAVYAMAARIMPHVDVTFVFAAAALFRLTLLPLGLSPGLEHFRSNLLLDDDAWRYLWDGHVWAQGGNPYLLAPAHTDVGQDHRWRTIRQNINHPDLPTIYPPVSQLLFLAAHAIAPGSLVALKALLIGCDLLAIAAMAGCLRRLGRPSSEVLLYAWNPLVILMFAGAAHADVLMLMLLALATYFLLGGSKRAAGVALGLATMTKLAPLVLFPLFLRRLGRKGSTSLLITSGVFSVAFVALSGLHTLRVFASTWDFNSATFELLRRGARPFTSDPDAWARLISVALLAIVIVRIDQRDRKQPVRALPDAAMNALGALVILSPAVMPWYATWPLAFAAMARRRTVWISFSAVICLSFPMTAAWKTDPAWLAAEWGGLAVITIIDRVCNQSGRWTVIPAEAGR